MSRYTGKKCRLISMFWLTAFFFIVEIAVGYVTNSMALVADSFHMLSDVAALVVAFLSVKVSRILIIVNFIGYYNNINKYLGVKVSFIFFNVITIDHSLHIVNNTPTPSLYLPHLRSLLNIVIVSR